MKKRRAVVKKKAAPRIYFLTSHLLGATDPTGTIPRSARLCWRIRKAFKVEVADTRYASSPCYKVHYKVGEHPFVDLVEAEGLLTREQARRALMAKSANVIDEIDRIVHLLGKHRVNVESTLAEELKKLPQLPPKR